MWHPSPNSGRAELRSIARYYRDRAGRVRVDFVGGMTPQRVIVTPDADSPVANFLDTVARTAVKNSRQTLGLFVGGGCFYDHFVLPLSMNRFVAFLGTRLDEESLRRTVDGRSAGHGDALRNGAAPKRHRHGAGRAVGIARAEACGTAAANTLYWSLSSINSARSAAQTRRHNCSTCPRIMSRPRFVV